MYTRVTFVACFLGLLTSWSDAADFDRKMNLTPGFAYLEAKQGEFDIESIRGEEVAERFEPVFRRSVALGYTGGMDHWFRFQLEGTERPEWRVLELSNPRLGEVTLFVPESEGNYDAFNLGIRRPFWDRQISGLSPAFPIRIKADSNDTCYLRVRHLGSLRFKALLWKWGAYNQHASMALAFSLVLSGALVALAFYNFCIFLHLRQRGYCWLALFLLACTLNLMVTSGTAPMLLWPVPNPLIQRAMTISSILALCLGIGLCNHLLREAPHARFYTRANVAFGSIALIGAVGSFSGHPATFYLTFLGGLLVPLSISAMAIGAVRAGQKDAIGFLACWGMMLISVLVTSLMGPGLIPATPLREQFIFVAIFFAAIGWSFTLTRQIKIKERDHRIRLEEEVKTLHGLLPICCSCKKIRDDDGYWQHVETYLHAHTTADFSHGLCPDCADSLYPDYFSGKKRGGDEEDGVSTS